MSWIMATGGAALIENRAGITFGVELYVPWDTPEAVVDIHSEGVVPLGSIQGYWPDWSSAGCCGKPNSAGKRCP